MVAQKTDAVPQPWIPGHVISFKEAIQCASMEHINHLLRTQLRDRPTVRTSVLLKNLHPPGVAWVLNDIKEGVRDRPVFSLSGGGIQDNELHLYEASRRETGFEVGLDITTETKHLFAVRPDNIFFLTEDGELRIKPGATHAKIYFTGPNAKAKNDDFRVRIERIRGTLVRRLEHSFDQYDPNPVLEARIFTFEEIENAWRVQQRRGGAEFMDTHGNWWPIAWQDLDVEYWRIQMFRQYGI